jgi:hypothetical protein
MYTGEEDTEEWYVDNTRPPERIWEPPHRPPPPSDDCALAKKLVRDYVHNAKNVDTLVRHMRENELSLV